MFKRLFPFFFFIALIFGAYVLWSLRGLPSVHQLMTEGVNPTRWTQVLASNGTPILSYGKFHHKNVKLSEVSPHFLKALIATEDRRFYSHQGVDGIAIARALVQDVVQKKFAEGGSTLTQQLARNIFLSDERSFKRKIREAVLAVQLEQQLSKDEILELYINNIFFGEGAYGISAASEIYFNKKPSQLTLEEGALLAGLPQAPSSYSPFANREAAKNRRNEVIDNLAEAGLISRDEANRRKKSGVRVNANGRELASSNRAPYFNQYVLKQIQDQYGMDEQTFWHSGLKIYTTLDIQAQGYAARAVRNMIPGSSQGSLVAIDPKTGGILAYVGGREFHASQFDRVTQAVRSPGSLFKVFTYTTAIDEGYQPSRVYLDEPIQAGDWKPENYDKKHHGYMTMAKALALSNNIIAVKVIQELTPPRVIEMTRRMGLHSDLESSLDITLGSTGVTLLDITSAIGVLANEGIRMEPYAIEKIVDRDGELVYEHSPGRSEVLPRPTVDTMVNMLTGVVQRGTGRAANIGRPVAGKTGTSDDNRDGWFIGFTPDVVAGVWVGRDDNGPVAGLSGGGLPASIWAAFMRPYSADKLSSNFDTSHGMAVTDSDYSGYDMGKLSETEANNPLAINQGRTLPEGDEPQMEEEPSEQPTQQEDENEPVMDSPPETAPRDLPKPPKPRTSEIIPLPAPTPKKRDIIPVPKSAQ